MLIYGELKRFDHAGFFCALSAELRLALDYILLQE